MNKPSSKKPNFRAGFVAIVGRPNAGKSTFINRVVGQKVAIVTDKPQTTRNRIQGIVTSAKGQIIFIDTPGLHEADSALGRQMMHEVAAALEGIDVLLLMVDASRALPYADSLLLQKAKRYEGKTILALNKVDRIPKAKLLPLIDALQKSFEFAAIVPISALKGTGVDELQREILQRLPESEPYFPEDQITDQPERFLAAEIIREKAIKIMYHEVPYALAVFIDKFEELPKLTRIEATLNVERNSQKKILIGEKGSVLKKVGTEARKELEELLGTKVYLQTFVKVAPNWRENPLRVRELDWHFQLEGLSSAQAKFGTDADASDPAALDTDASGAGEADLPDDADEELDRPPAGAKADLYEGLHDGPVDGDDIDDGPVDKDDV
ncbi:MAG TPA: GTPase Era [Candidatus Acidoferrum sp.]|nr:GTPase Era [Candidatus Acidoferrum sp.]